MPDATARRISAGRAGDSRGCCGRIITIRSCTSCARSTGRRNRSLDRRVAARHGACLTGHCKTRRTGGTRMTIEVTRRIVLAGAAVLPLPGILRALGDDPEFEMKLGNDNPMSHPNTIRQQEAVDRILKETNGRVKIAV